MKAETCHDNVQ